MPKEYMKSINVVTTSNCSSSVGIAPPPWAKIFCSSSSSSRSSFKKSPDNHSYGNPFRNRVFKSILNFQNDAYCDIYGHESSESTSDSLNPTHNEFSTLNQNTKVVDNSQLYINEINPFRRKVFNSIMGQQNVISTGFCLPPVDNPKYNSFTLNSNGSSLPSNWKRRAHKVNNVELRNKKSSEKFVLHKTIKNHEPREKLFGSHINFLMSNIKECHFNTRCSPKVSQSERIKEHCLKHNLCTDDTDLYNLRNRNWLKENDDFHLPKINKRKRHFVYSKLCQKFSCHKKSYDNVSSNSASVARTQKSDDEFIRSHNEPSECRRFIVKFSVGVDEDEEIETCKNKDNLEVSSENPLKERQNNESLVGALQEHKPIPRVLTLIELARDPSVDNDLCSCHDEGITEELKKCTFSGVENNVLCGNRVSQMTRTYHDIEAVTRLLQEKEKDLELAARIGQQLLTRNKTLEEKNAILEGELLASSEKITQLKHDLLMKAELLQIYTNDFDESSVEASPTGYRSINMDLLQRRVKNLESENVYLREEATQLSTDTQYCEEKEKELVNDVIKQLNEANLQVNQLSEELSKKIEYNLKHQEENTQLLAQVVELQASTKRLSRENEELGILVTVARECQEELTTELAQLKEKYSEVLDLLHDTQEQLRRVQKRNVPGSRGTHLGTRNLFSLSGPGNDSIASELYSLNSTNEDGSENSTPGTKNLSRVFDTVRLSSRIGSPMPPSIGSSSYSTPTRMSSALYSTSPHYGTPLHSTDHYSAYFGGSRALHGGPPSSGLPSLDSGAESDASFPTDSEDNYPASHAGVPGYPGTPDLDACLKRSGPTTDKGYLSYLPYGCRTPDSIMSTGSLRSGTSGYASQDWKLPQKLQIVKPIEGSLTLHHWSRLATPNLGGLLEDKEGIAIKGATSAGLNMELYSMSDLEEDDTKEVDSGGGEEEECGEELPVKQFMTTSGIFTLTNSTILHPDDVTNITPSLKPSQMYDGGGGSGPHSLISVSTSSSSLPPTPSHGTHSRRGSTATFSTNVGLAKHLRERGLANLHRVAVSPTATPANSPEGSRSGSPVNYPYKLPGLDDLTKGIHAGASFLRKTFYGVTGNNPLDPPSPDEDPEFKLVEKVQALGVDRLVGPVGPPRSFGGVVTSRAPSSSPILHLSNLMRSGAQTKSSLSSEQQTTLENPRTGSIMSAPKIGSSGRLQIIPGSKLGVPGHPGSGQLDTRLTQLKPGQRADLGTVGPSSRPSTLGSGPPGRRNDKMGTVGWSSFGRKGGLL